MRGKYQSLVDFFHYLIRRQNSDGLRLLLADEARRHDITSEVSHYLLETVANTVPYCQLMSL